MQNKRSASFLTVGAALLTLSSAGMCGSISAVSVEPASGLVGQQVKVTVTGEDEGICALRVEYGNGDADVTKMSEGRDRFPRSFMKSYGQAGTYTIIAKGGREGMTLGCPGEAKTTVTIRDVPRPAVSAPSERAEPAAARTAPVPASSQPVFGGGKAVTPSKGSAPTSGGAKTAPAAQEAPGTFGGSKRAQ